MSSAHPSPVPIPSPPAAAQASAPTQGSRAAGADRHRLYERAVQCPEAEIDFVEARFAWLRNRPAHALREDFCGTAAVCREWVSRDGARTAVGLDLDAEVLAWAGERAAALLTPQAQARLSLVQGDVMHAPTPTVDVVLAMNFSYWLFRDRSRLLAYFSAVRRTLAEDGVFFLDAYGGYDAFREIVEEREIEDDEGTFTYRWEQARYDPISGDMDCHIHFSFADGSELNRAFSYRWRLWTLPEIRELLAEAGFRRVLVYWQGWDDDGEPDGHFAPAEQADADAGWICYLSAEV